MTTPNITLNPALASSVTGSFGTEWNGLIAGMSMPDPDSLYWLSAGFLASSETLPMYGGILISEAVPTPQTSPPLTPNPSLGGPIIRATNVAGAGNAGNATGFSVFDQNYSAVNSPQSEVPLTPTYGAVNFYRFGSNRRIAVPCSTALSTLEANPITALVSWDYTAQMLIPYSAAYAQATISGATWASTGGGQTQFTVNVDYSGKLDAGDLIEVTGVVNTGGSSTSAFNGQWSVVSVDDATHITVATPSSVSLGTYASGGLVLAGGGALPVRVLKFEFGNSMTVSYNSTTGFANWNRSGNAALILI